MKNLFFLIFVSLTSVTHAADSICDQALIQSSPTDYSSSFAELARGFIMMEQIKTEGIAPDSAYRTMRRAFSEKRLQLIDLIGDEAKFEEMFSKALEENSSLHASEQKRQRQQRKARVDNEADSIGLWTQAQVLFSAKDKVESLNMSPDGRWLAIKLHASSRVVVLDAGTFKTKYSFKLLRKHETEDIEFGTYNIEFSPDSKNLLVSHGDSALLYDLSSGLRKTIATFSRESHKVQFSPDGQHILMTSTDQILLMSLSDEKTKRIAYVGSNSVLRTVYFSDDSQNIIITTSDDIRVFDINGTELGKIETSLNGGQNFLWAKLTPDKSKIISASSAGIGHYVETWDFQKLSDKSFFARFKNKVKPVEVINFTFDVIMEQYAPTGEFFFNTKEGLVAYDSTQNNLVTYEDQVEVISSSFSPNDQYLTIIGKDSRIHVWDMKAKLKAEDFEFKDAVSVQMSPDAKKLFIIDKRANLLIYTRAMKGID